MLDRFFLLSQVKTLENFDYSEENRIILNQIDPSVSLTIIETTTYFEAYRPVLKALQMIKSDRFPLAPFLLKLSNVITPPDYIKPETTYDFSPLLTDRSRKVNRIEALMPVEERYKSVSILKKEEWPTSEQLHLNPKQYEALMLALTNKVALIQGRESNDYFLFL